MSKFQGVIVPIVTPFNRDDAQTINYEAGEKLVEKIIAAGADGIFTFGSNGEFYMLEEDEMEHGLRIIVDRTARRVPVYFGIGAINAKKCCRLAKMAVANGTAAVSVLQPMFLKPTHDELFLHFKTIAGSIPDTPVLLYNNPGRVGYTLTTPAGAARDGFVRTMTAAGLL